MGWAFPFPFPFLSPSLSSSSAAKAVLISAEFMSELKLRPPVGTQGPVFSWARKLRRGRGGDCSGRGAVLKMTRCTGEYAGLKPGATEAAKRRGIPRLRDLTRASPAKKAKESRHSARDDTVRGTGREADKTRCDCFSGRFLCDGQRGGPARSGGRLRFCR